MNNDFLKRLYCACSDPGRHMAQGANLGELYERLDDSEHVDRLFCAVLDGSGLSEDKLEPLHDCHNDVCQAYEQQGFVNGFRLGLMLAGELRQNMVEP